MKRDSRGRVRFGHKGYRFELNNNGLTIYRRVGTYCYTRESALYPSEYHDGLRGLLSTEEGRAKLADALTAVDVSPFTSAVHIPPHMKAVR